MRKQPDACDAMMSVRTRRQDDGLGKRYPVSGTVTYNGNPLEKGEISFVSEDLKNNFGASGQIIDGSYTPSTGGNGDGRKRANKGDHLGEGGLPRQGQGRLPERDQATSLQRHPASRRSSSRRPKRRPRAPSRPVTAIRAPRSSRPMLSRNRTRSTSSSPTPRSPRSRGHPRRAGRRPQRAVVVVRCNRGRAGRPGSPLKLRASAKSQRSASSVFSGPSGATDSALLLIFQGLQERGTSGVSRS